MPVDDVGSGSTPHAPLFPGHLSALIEDDGSNIPALLDGSLDQVRVLPDIHEENFEALVLELAVDSVNGRQLLPAVGSPGGPEEDQDHLPREVCETNRLPL